MNILKYELRAGLKAFLFWSLGLFVLVYMGMIKYTGIGAATDLNVMDLINQIPRVMLAVLGMIGIDITSLGGYYSILIYYVLICISVYGLSLGIHAINREEIDKTYEFLYTKPRSRFYILKIKLLTAFIYLVSFSFLSCIFSYLAIYTLKINNTIQKPIILFTVTILLTGLLFCAIGSFVAAITKRTEKGAMYGNLLFLITFVISILYDMLENGGLLRLLAPFKYFTPWDILEGNLDIGYVILCISCIIILEIGALLFFEKKDLNGL